MCSSVERQTSNDQTRTDHMQDTERRQHQLEKIFTIEAVPAGHITTRIPSSANGRQSNIAWRMMGHALDWLQLYSQNKSIVQTKRWIWFTTSTFVPNTVKYANMTALLEKKTQAKKHTTLKDYFLESSYLKQLKKRT